MFNLIGVNLGFSVVFLLMPNRNDTISEQTGELLKLWLSILSRIGFQRRKLKKKKTHQRFLKHGLKKNKDARRQSYYGIEVSIGQGNVQTQKLFIPWFFFVCCLLFPWTPIYSNTNVSPWIKVPPRYRPQSATDTAQCLSSVGTFTGAIPPVVSIRIPRSI